MKNLAYKLLLPMLLTLAAVQSVSFSFTGGHEKMVCRRDGHRNFCSRHSFRTPLHFPVSHSRLDALPPSGLSCFELIHLAARSAVRARCISGLELRLMTV